MLKTLKKYKAPYLFILPFFILFLAFQLIPTIWTFYISLTNWKGIGQPQFCGFNNYKKLLIDNMFWDALGNTVVYWVTGLVFILILSVLIASLLNSDLLKGKAFFRTVTFLPNICAAIAMGLIFRMLFDENVGLFNEFLAWLGLSLVPMYFVHSLLPACLAGVLVGVGIAGVTANLDMVNSVLIEDDAARYGVRREATFFAGISFITRLSSLTRSPASFEVKPATVSPKRRLTPFSRR